jgi:ABC-2 type transport system permease protein
MSRRAAFGSRALGRDAAALGVALRLQRAGWMACALLAGVVALGTAASFPSVIGATTEQRLASARQLGQLARPISVLLPIPNRVETLGGYVQWRVFGGLPFVIAGWALLAGTAAIRGEEQRGLLEQWLASGFSRARWVAVRAVGFALALATVALLAGMAAAAGAALGGGRLPAGPLLGACVALGGLGLACFGVGLLAGQLVASRQAAVALAGVCLAVLHLLNSLPRGTGQVPASRWLSPFYWYERSNPLVPGDHLDTPATLALVAAGVLLPTLAAAALTRRDLGRPLVPGRSAAPAPTLVPSANPAWRHQPVAALYEQRLALLSWVAVAATLALALTALARPIVQALQTTPATRGSSRLLASGDPERVLVGYFLFGTLQLLIALYALVQVGRWSAEDQEGRLEMILSTPIARRRVVVDRALALAAGAAVIAVAGTVAGWLSARNQAIPLPAGNLTVAAALLLPFGLSFGAAGAALAGWRPRLALLGLGAAIAVNFFLLEFGIVFDWPAWLLRLSVFDLYGTPLVTGVWWPGLAALVSLSAAGFGIAAAALQRRDIGR